MQEAQRAWAESCLPLPIQTGPPHAPSKTPRSGPLFSPSSPTNTLLQTHTATTQKGELVIIDVSQAVDLDHPKALDFLREDAKHINDYFRRAALAAPGGDPSGIAGNLGEQRLVSPSVF